MEDKFTELFKEILEMEGQDLDVNASFREFENWNSLANLSVIAMLDDEFGVHIENKDFKNIHTVSELIAEVKKRMQ